MLGNKAAQCHIDAGLSALAAHFEMDQQLGDKRVLTGSFELANGGLTSGFGDCAARSAPTIRENLQALDAPWGNRRQCIAGSRHRRDAGSRFFFIMAKDICLVAACYLSHCLGNGQARQTA